MWLTVFSHGHGSSRTSIHENVKDDIHTECGKQLSAMDHLRRLHIKLLKMLFVLSVVNHANELCWKEIDVTFTHLSSVVNVAVAVVNINNNETDP